MTGFTMFMPAICVLSIISHTIGCIYTCVFIMESWYDSSLARRAPPARRRSRTPPEHTNTNKQTEGAVRAGTLSQCGTFLPSSLRRWRCWRSASSSAHSAWAVLTVSDQ